MAGEMSCQGVFLGTEGSLGTSQLLWCMHTAPSPAPSPGLSAGAWQWKGIWEAPGAVLCSAPGAVQLRRLHFIKTVKLNN